MPKRRELLVAALIVILFLITNRAAYQGYFSGDDLDNIDWTSRAGAAVFVRGLMTLEFNPDNFRPVGHVFFRLMGAAADLHFAPYLAVSQILHLGVALLIFLLAKNFGISPAASALGALFFVFHMALFGAFWKPMYVFDVLCAFFCCLSVLAWRRSGALWWIVSFLCFWLAYKSKEVAVMLPAVLVMVEFLNSERRWLRVIPFLGVSLMFGVQAILYSLMGSLKHTVGPYQLQLTWQTLASTVAFYGQHVLLSFWGLILLAAILVLARRRWGAAAALLFLVPMLVLPGRTFSVYLYVPLAFLALTVASAAERSVKVAGLLVAGWLAINFMEMRHLRNDTLRESREARDYVATIDANKPALMRMQGVRFDGYPVQLNPWGVKAAVRHLTNREDLAGVGGSEAVLSWQPRERKLYVFGEHPVSFLDMTTGTPIQRADTGWYSPESDFRWTQPVARLHLVRPPGTKTFEWKVQVPAEQLVSANGRVTIETLLDGKMLTPVALDEAGWKSVQATELPATGKLVDVELRVKPPFRPPGDGRELGVAVGAIGFR